MKRFFLRGGVAAVALVCAALLGGNLSAQQGGNGIQISPTRTEINVGQGEQKQFKISLKNITQGPITARAVVNDFESNNENGEPQIIVDENRKSDFTIRNFLKGLQDVSLAAGETKEVTLSLDIPGDQAPGAYFGAVRFTVVPQGGNQTAQERQIALNASVASLVLVQVPGDVTEGMKFESLNVQRTELDGSNSKKVLSAGSFFFNGAPNNLETRLTNTGNSFVQPFGQVTIFKGGNQVHSFEFNNTRPRGNLLPKSSRTFDNEIKNIGSFGKYEVVSSLSFKQGGEVFTLKRSFWVIPLWMVIALVVAIVAIIAAIFILTRRMRKS